MERSLVGLIDDDHTENTQMGVRKHILCGWMNLLTHTFHETHLPGCSVLTFSSRFTTKNNGEETKGGTCSWPDRAR